MKTIAIIPVYGNSDTIRPVLERFEPASVDGICVVADKPGPATLEGIDEARRTVQVEIKTVLNSVRKGIGYAIRQGYKYALENQFELIVIMAGNGKDDPSEIPRLKRPILEEGYDYVQGSRFLPGGRRANNPFLRSVFTRVFPYIWSIMTGVRCTEVTNGFRAYRASILEDPRINVWQSWLDNYELEYYLHYKVLTLGYKFAERPVSKDYSALKDKKYSHISASTDWWQIVGPLFLLRMGVRK